MYWLSIDAYRHKAPKYPKLKKIRILDKRGDYVHQHRDKDYVSYKDSKGFIVKYRIWKNDNHNSDMIEEYLNQQMGLDLLRMECMQNNCYNKI